MGALRQVGKDVNANRVRGRGLGAAIEDGDAWTDLNVAAGLSDNGDPIEAGGAARQVGDVGDIALAVDDEMMLALFASVSNEADDAVAQSPERGDRPQHRLE